MVANDGIAHVCGEGKAIGESWRLTCFPMDNLLPPNVLHVPGFLFLSRATFRNLLTDSIFPANMFSSLCTCLNRIYIRIKHTHIQYTPNGIVKQPFLHGHQLPKLVVIFEFAHTENSIVVKRYIYRPPSRCFQLSCSTIKRTNEARKKNRGVNQQKVFP